MGPLGKSTLVSFFKEKGVLLLPSERLRLVTLLDGDLEDMKKIASLFQEFYANESLVENSTKSSPYG